MTSHDLRNLYGDLTEDKWRKDHVFSEHMLKIHEIVFHPYRTDAQREEAYLLWLQRFQPCLFGRIAAAKQRLHFCFLGEDDLMKSDQEVAAQIQQDRIAWKQRSLRPHPELSNPAHGFLLVAVSPRLALAAPDANLRAFTEKLLSLWGVPQSDEASGHITSETLFLQHPNEREYVQFRFSVDFFMAQGDGRWWQDHRIPGGLAFTANSAGHMRRYREWYEGMTQQEEWVLQTAMLTIHSAAETPYGRATWLRPLINGQPHVSGLKCPFSNPDKVKPELQGKDWTRYGGHLHTDHAIREEFFWNEPEKVADITATEYLEDFAYLYDPRQKDHVLFVQGQNVAESAVFDEIGNPEDYVRIVGNRPKPTARSFDDGTAAHPGAIEVEQKLRAIRPWALTELEN
jgi:hypothetical protein